MYIYSPNKKKRKMPESAPRGPKAPPRGSQSAPQASKELPANPSGHQFHICKVPINRTAAVTSTYEYIHLAMWPYSCIYV